jgi:hypothetical protein|tara:strand:+ start:42 stop:362 length:321 start_codon:yes stop_codon:yes gene_type:complete
MIQQSHLLGDRCELILAEFLLSKSFYVFTNILAQRSPIDLIAVHPETAKLFFFDSKADRERTNPGRKVPARIYRKRSDFQKKIGLTMAYVNIETKNIYFTPKFPYA